MPKVQTSMERSIAFAGGAAVRQRSSRDAKRPFYKFVYFDIESTQEEANGYEHVFALCVVHVCCEWCACQEDPDAYLHCTHHSKLSPKYVFHDAQSFFSFFISLRNATLIAHNFQGYDAYFVLHLLTENGIVYEPIMNGAKCMYIKLGKHNVRFVDSYNFLHMPLADFPTTFEFEERKKGHFPHFFNTIANRNYVGPLPAVDFYGAKFMNEKKQKELLEWWSEANAAGVQLDMATDMVSYCDNDVELLRRGCNKYRLLNLKIGKTDIFRECITLAGASMRIYRRLFMPEKTIAIRQEAGKNTKFSRKQMSWLGYIQHSRGIQLRTAASPDGEKCYGRYRFDGYCRETNTVYEFYGSYWHGDLRVFRPDVVNESNRMTMGEANAQTIFRELELRSVGFDVQSCWEKDWDLMCVSNQDVRAYLKLREANVNTDTERALESCVPLDVADAFFGGRTNATKLYVDCEENEKLCVCDINSLYPNVCAKQPFPVGTPQIIKNVVLDAHFDVSDYFGFMKCIVLPPNDEYLPILPFRHPESQKLLFPLCKMCALNCGRESSLQCTHADEERVWVGTWCTPELAIAVNECGYKLLHVFEIHHFRKEQYDPISKTGGIVSAYMQALMQLKQEASKIPDCFKENIAEYIEQSREKENIILDPAKIKYNPGMRLSAKGLANSWWGKLAQKENKERTAVVKDYNELNSYLHNVMLDVICITFLPIKNKVVVETENFGDTKPKHGDTSEGNCGGFLDTMAAESECDESETPQDLIEELEKDEKFELENGSEYAKISASDIDEGKYMAIVQYVYYHEITCLSGRTNLPIASFVPMWGRLSLFEVARELQSRLVYYDTDSVTFKSKIKLREGEIEYAPPEGVFMGEWVYEYGGGDGEYITNFCSAGPKNYTFLTNKGKVIHKHKGIRMDVSVANVLSYQTIKEMVLSSCVNFLPTDAFGTNSGTCARNRATDN